MPTHARQLFYPSKSICLECIPYFDVRGKGIPIVFIHPPVLTSANFTYQIEALSEEFKIFVILITKQDCDRTFERLRKYENWEYIVI